MELVSDNTSKDTMVETTLQYRCVVAETDFYKSGELYTIYRDNNDLEDKNWRRYVRGSDGIYDDVALTNSSFKEVKPNARKKET